MSTETDTTTTEPHPDRIGIEELLQRAAEHVEKGFCEIEDVQPEEYHEMDIETFRDEVRERLDVDDDDDHRVREEPDGEPTSEPAEIDWAAMLEAAGIDAGAQLSMTQWKLVIDISEQTRIGHDGAPALVERAVDAGVLALEAVGTYTSEGTGSVAYEYAVADAEQ